MAASTEQKLDYLLKKIGYTASKTGLAEDSSLSGTKKAPFAEAIPSPLVTPSTTIWNESALIPTTPPGSDTGQVRVYLAGTSGHRMTVDSTVSGSRAFIAYSTYNDTSSGILGDWIDPQFGDAYIIKVYKGDPNSGGVLLSAAGAGSNDTWFFDYSSGVLNFNGTVIPSGVTDTNIYIVGYRYIGVKGLSTAGINTSATSTFKNLSVTGISTFGDDVNLHGNAGVTSAFWDKSDGSLKFLDNVEAKFGSDSRLQIYGDSLSGSVIKTTAGGLAEVITAAWSVSDGDGSTKRIEANGTDVDLYFSGSKKFSTTGIGASVLGQLEVNNGINVTSGVSTFTGNINANGNIVGDNATNISGINSVTATSLFANLTGNVTGIATYTSEWIITSNGSSDYKFTGPGFDGTELDPTIYLTRGHQYKFTNNMGAHPFQIRTAVDGSAYNDGIVNNGVSNGTLTWDVQMDAPNVLYYQCTAHAGMVGKIYIGNSGNSINVGNGVTIAGNGIVVTGIVTATNFVGVSSVTATDFFGTLQTAAQPNITSLGTLTGLDVDGHTNLDNVSIAGVATVTGSNINIEGGSAALTQLKINSTGRFRGIQLDENGTRKAHFQHDATDNITVVGTAEGTMQFNSGDTPRVILNSSGHWVPFADSTYDLGISATRWRNLFVDNIDVDQLNVTGVTTFAGNINANGNIVGDDATNILGISSVTASNFFGTLQTAAQPNVTSLGTLTSLNVTGDVSIGGTLTYEDVTNIDSVGIITARTGIKVLAGGINAVGVVTATTFSGDISGVGATFTNITGTLQTAAQTNITSVGTLGALTVSGNINANGNIVGDNSTNISGINSVTAVKFFGDGEGLTNVGVDTVTVNTDRITTGTLNVTGVSTFAGLAKFNGNFEASGNVTLGDGTGDNIDVQGRFVRELVPSSNGDKDLGTSSFRWGTLHVKNILQAGGGTVDVGFSTFREGIFVTGVSTFSNSSNAINANSTTTNRAINVQLNGVTKGGLTPESDGLELDVNGGNNLTMHLNQNGGSTSDFIVKSDDIELFKIDSGTIESTFISTDTGSSAGPVVNLYRNSASPADADYLGQIKFQGESDTGVQRNYAKITGKILDASNTSEDGIIEFAHIKAGSQTITGRFRSDSLQLLNGTNFSVAGTSEFTDTATFTGNIDANGDLDVDGHTELDNLGVSGISTFTDNVRIDADNKKLQIGDGQDLELYHGGGHSYITNSTGEISILNTNGTVHIRGVSTEGGIEVTNNETVKLYGASNTVRLITSNTGVTVTGTVVADGLDVSGHSELDNLNVSGVSTFAGNINANGNIIGDNATNISGINSVTASAFYGDGSNLSNVGFTTSIGTFNASSGVATIDSFAHATEDYKVAEYTLHFTNGSNIQAQKLLVMQDGTTAYSQEFAVMSSASQLVSLDATISGANVLVRATPESGISGTTTFRWRRIVQE